MFQSNKVVKNVKVGMIEPPSHLIDNQIEKY